MRFLPKLVLLLFFFFLLTFSFLAIVYADEKPIPPPTVPCKSVDSPEFHSLRPYQASPCLSQVQDEALFCGNDLTLKDTVKVAKSGAISCEDKGESIVCQFRVNRSATVAIDLSNAELPILGNTQLTANSQSQDQSLDAADRVNDYVSWYLSGVAKKAEDSPPDPKSPEGEALIKDFAGPVQKLTPWSIQNTLRTNTVKAASKTRHDQVVGCVNLVGGITPCYPQRAGVREIRLSYWGKKLPPKESDFKKYNDFWLAYRRWRGDFCLSLLSYNLCFDNPFTFRYTGNLFANIPFSSTEDRKGAAEVETVALQKSGDVTVSNLVFSNQKPADLFFAHMEEANQLGDILQSTFVPKGQDKLGGKTANAGAGAPACDLAQIRTNPGDNLFAGEIKGDLTYTADFSCEFPKTESSGNPCGPGLPKCPDGEGCNQNGKCAIRANPGCSKDIFVDLGLITKTPLADEIYSRLVVGSASIFKRIFPKIEAGGALSALFDIPGATKVEYKSLAGPQLVYAGNQENERKGENAELYFPHVGSLSEYFLKGIQTILRPKGYGEQIISGQPSTIPTAPPTGKTDCNQNAPAVNIPGLISRAAFAALANRWTGGDNFADECFNDVVGRSIRSGVNPAYALITWLIESGASNYGVSVEDFGVHLGDVRGFSAQIERFLGTVTGAAHQYCSRNGVPPWPSELFGHIACYVTGEYDQSRPDYVRLKDRVQKYFEDFTSYFTSTIAPGCGLPTGPTDNKCP